MNYMKNLQLLSIAFLLFCSVQINAQSAWILEKNENGIKVYTRIVAGSSLKEYKGETNIATTLSALLAVFDDINAATQWVHNCTSAKRLKVIDKFEGYNYYVITAPWPVSDRDLINHYKITQNTETKTITITLTGKKDYIAETDNVRVPKLTGTWQFIPQPNKTINIVYQVHSDSGGSVPSSISNAFVVDIPFNTLTNLKKMVLISKYKTAINKDIVEP